MTHCPFAAAVAAVHWLLKDDVEASVAHVSLPIQGFQTHVAHVFHGGYDDDDDDDDDGDDRV